MRGFSFNTRTLSAPQSGVQRYVRELDVRFGNHVRRLKPAWLAQGMAGHLWEQVILPFRSRGTLLFSPGNSGPLLCRRQVLTLHDASTFDQPDAFTGIYGHWYRWLLPKLARRVQGIITVSEFSRERLASTLGIPAAKIAVVHNGITQPPARPGKEFLAGIRTELGLPARFLLFVGSRDPRKNIDRLIEAFELADLKDVKLVIAGGSNPHLFKTKISATNSDKVRILGHVDDSVLESLYALAEGFVFPSLYEGFGLPPLEAMARGCPVLCSNASCLPEVCGPSLEEGGACLYFSPYQTESIASALQAFDLLSPGIKNKMISAGYRQVSKFSWVNCASQTTAALQRFSQQTENQFQPESLEQGLPSAKRATDEY